MEIAKQFEKASIPDIEAHIERLANERDSMNKDLIALNALRDAKVKEVKRAKAAAAFQAEYGAPPEQVVRPESAVGSASAEGFGGLLSRIFGMGRAGEA